MRRPLLLFFGVLLIVCIVACGGVSTSPANKNEVRVKPNKPNPEAPSTAKESPISTPTNEKKNMTLPTPTILKKEDRLSVEIVKVRVEPFRTANGIDTVMVCVDWKNTGTRTVRAVDAKLIGYDIQDKEVEILSLPDYTIYAVFSDSNGIAPGETYTVPKGRGFIVLENRERKPIRATATITKVDEQGIK